MAAAKDGFTEHDSALYFLLPAMMVWWLQIVTLHFGLGVWKAMLGIAITHLK